jgi:hypothetical protein
METETEMEEVADNNLFLMQFVINSMSLELQSQGQRLVSNNMIINGCFRGRVGHATL